MGDELRRRINLNKGWEFAIAGKSPVQVDVPHTWNAEDGQDGGDDYYRGKGLYRKTVPAPEFDRENQRVFLEFQGVNASAKVFLNGEEVGSHDGGYSTFRFDVTDKLQETNELTVEADNSINDRVYPQKADFTFYGGIYRDVNFIVVNKRHFDMEYYGGPGIKVKASLSGPSVGKEILPVSRCGNLEIVTYTDVKDAKVRVTILDAEGQEVAQEEKEPGAIYIYIHRAHRWDGIEDPYLYTAKAELLWEGEVQDVVTTKFGFRTFYANPQSGFYLNGRPYPLHGVSRHQDFKGIGNAITKEYHDRDMAMIRELGANTIRLAHYQHDQYFYDLCDEYGMIVWAEIPYISEHMPGGRENTVSQMKELIVQNYNHPSIVTWGLSNEITISTKDKEDMLDNHHLLNDLCHEMDPTRPTTLACYAMCNPFGKVVHISDLVSYNLYLGWYVPGLFLNDMFLWLFHLRYPKRPLGYSEYGAEGMPNLHSEHPHRGDHTEEYQAVYHEYMIKCFERFPFMWATHIWNMFDFAADARDQGGEPGMNHKGLVTFDRKTKKDSFYLYKAYWNPEPMVHICSKRFEERGTRKIKVKVYSNQDSVSLYQNGTLVGTKKSGSKKKRRVFVFSVQLEDVGEFEAVAGECRDSATFRYMEHPRSYRLEKKKSSSANWV